MVEKLNHNNIVVTKAVKIVVGKALNLQQKPEIQHEFVKHNIERKGGRAFAVVRQEFFFFLNCLLLLKNMY